MSAHAPKPTHPEGIIAQHISEHPELSPEEPSAEQTLRALAERSFAADHAHIAAGNESATLFAACDAHAAFQEAATTPTILALYTEIDTLRAALAEAQQNRDSHQRVAIAAMAERDDWKKLAIELGANGKATRDLNRNDLTLSMRVDEGLLRLGKLDVLTATFQKMRDEYAAWLKADAARATPKEASQ